MNRGRYKLVGWVCVVVGLGLVLIFLRSRQQRSSLYIEVEVGSVTKPFSRDSSRPGHRNERTKNPREAFENARKRGMTEEEVRFIVEDYAKLGILSKPPEEISPEHFHKIGIKARSWYGEVLVEGFGLIHRQEVEVTERLRELGKKDLANFKEDLARFHDFVEKWEAGDAEARASVFSLEYQAAPTLRGDYGLVAEVYLPWNLCELNEGQKEMIGLKYENDQWIWPRPGSVTIDYGTEDQYLNLDDPFEEGSGINSCAGKVFPLSMAQVDGIRGAKIQYNQRHPGGDTNPPLLNQLKFLTAPQLMTLLLFNPELTEQIMKEMGE